MAWKASDTVSLRREFVDLAAHEDANIARLCRRFGVSRQTGYKWIGRFEREGGERALVDRSRRPHGSPGKTGEAVEQRVAALRAEHPAWGPRKLRRVLVDRGLLDGRTAPSPSTIGRILLRRGLVDADASPRHRPFVRFEKEHPNELWQMDFKGHFAMLDGARCHPLTVLDDHSRYALELRACRDERGDTVKGALITLFGRYGQPRRILCDNGSPWGSGGGEPYTELSVWLMLHGIAVSHGRPRHPQTQGKDERFHRTIDDEVLRYHHPRDLGDSQRNFDGFRQTYNHQRPHESLGLATPASRWRPSEREFQSDPLPPPQYRGGDTVRKVDAAGKLSLRGRAFRISKALVGQHVGLRATEVDGLLTVLLGDVPMGRLDLRDGSAAMCCAPPPVAALPAPGHSTKAEQSVNHVSEHVSPLTPV